MKCRALVKVFKAIFSKAPGRKAGLLATASFVGIFAAWEEIKWIIFHLEETTKIPSDSVHDVAFVWDIDAKIPKKMRKLFASAHVAESDITSSHVQEYVIKSLRSSGLNVERAADLSDSKHKKQYQVLLITAPFELIGDTLCRLQYQKRCPDGTRFPFSLVQAARGRFGPFMKDPCRYFYATDEIHKVVQHAMYAVRAADGRSMVPLLVQAKVLSSTFPLHNNTIRAEVFLDLLKQRNMNGTLERLGVYFGSLYGFYFAWTHQYICWLVLLSIPAFSLHWFGQDETSPNPATFAFSLVVTVWATLFLEFWKRESAVFAFKWGVSDYEQEALAHDTRSEFRGTLQRNPITREYELYYPAWRRKLKYCVTYPIILLCLAVVIFVMLFCFWLEDVTSGWQENNYFSYPIVNTYIHMLPSVLYSISIPVLNMLYTKIAIQLTVWENHRTDETYRTAYVIKSVLFFFCNNYVGLFYSAFYLKDMERLKKFMRSIFITTQVLGNVVEGLVPYLSEKYAIGSSLYKKTKKTKDLDAVEVEDSSPNNASSASPRMAAHEMEWKMPAPTAVFDEYLELVMQFGYIVMFGWCWPLAAVFALLNNIVEIRLDAHKLCVSCQRPFVKLASGIGPWYWVLQIFTFIGIATNLAFVCIYLLDYESGKVTGIELPLWVLPSHPDITALQQSQHISSHIDLVQLPPTWRIVLVVLFEHIVIFFKFFLMGLIEDVPESIQDAVAKNKHIIAVAARKVDMEEEEDSKKLN